MKRSAALILFALSIVAGGVLFSVAFEVSALEDRLIVLNQEITSDRDAIHVLRAEWSYLNQPERLEGLSRRYLDLQPLEGSQFSEIAALPVRPTPALSPADATPAEPETLVASAPNATPRLKPAAPRRPSRHVRLVSQPATTIPGMSASDSAALNASLRAILGNAAGNPGGVAR
jgi:hypothetical protein